MSWIAKGQQEFNFLSTIRITLAHPGSPHLCFTLINFPRTNIWKLPTPGPRQPIHSPVATEELPSAGQERSTAPEAGEGSLLLLLQTHLSSNGMSSVPTAVCFLLQFLPGTSTRLSVRGDLNTKSVTEKKENQEPQIS